MSTNYGVKPVCSCNHEKFNKKWQVVKVKLEKKLYKALITVEEKATTHKISHKVDFDSSK